MTGHAHRLGGLCIGAVTAYYSTKIPILAQKMSLEVFALAPIGMTFGCLFPDIDTPYSMISMRFRKFSRIICRHTEHRMLMHCPIIPLLLAVIGLFLYGFFPHVSYFAICFAAGYFFHLIQDTFTKGGIPWAYPFIKKRFSFLPMRSGSLFEWIIVFALIFAYSEIWNSFLPY